MACRPEDHFGESRTTPRIGRRSEMAYAEVRRLCALDEAELDRLEQQLDEVIVFNARHGPTQLPKLFRGRCHPALVADILGTG
jgi:hypothetical protein